METAAEPYFQDFDKSSQVDNLEKKFQNIIVAFIFVLNVATSLIHFYCCLLQTHALESGTLKIECTLFSEYTLSRFYISFIFWIVMLSFIFLYVSMKCHYKTRSLMYKSILLIHEATRQAVKINNQTKNCKIRILKLFELFSLLIMTTYFAIFLFIDGTVLMKMIETCDEQFNLNHWLRTSLCLIISTNTINLVSIIFCLLILGFRCKSSQKILFNNQDFLTVIQ